MPCHAVPPLSEPSGAYLGLNLAAAAAEISIDVFEPKLGWMRNQFSPIYRAEKKGWYVVTRYFFLALLNFSAWPCLAVA